MLRLPYLMPRLAFGVGAAVGSRSRSAEGSADVVVVGSATSTVEVVVGALVVVGVLVVVNALVVVGALVVVVVVVV